MGYLIRGLFAGVGIYLMTIVLGASCSCTV